MIFKFLVVVLAASGLCFAKTAYQQAAIDKHNALRARHGGPDVSYDESLEAQSVKCAGKYSSGEQVPHQCAIPDVGENAFQQWGGGDDVTETEIVCQAIQDWYNEISNYTFADPKSAPSTCGHFTQVVWKASVNVGCGFGISGTTKAVVCSYTPQGNVHFSGDGVDEYTFFRENVVPPQ